MWHSSVGQVTAWSLSPPDHPIVDACALLLLVPIGVTQPHDCTICSGQLLSWVLQLLQLGEFTCPTLKAFCDKLYSHDVSQLTPIPLKAVSVITPLEGCPFGLGPLSSWGRLTTVCHLPCISYLGMYDQEGVSQWATNAHYSCFRTALH